VITEDLLVLAKNCGAVKEGHFLLASGLHSGVYVEKFHLLERPEILATFVSHLLPRITEPFEHIVGPALGGMIVAYEVARQTGLPASYAEKGPDGNFLIRRGKGISRGDRILVVDDVMTTGGSVRKTIQAVKNMQAEVVTVGVLVDRAAEPPRDFTYQAALRYVLPAYSAEKCPLCAKAIPLVRLGG
jgi:orotate phosphoribosyltransferase